MRKGLPAALPAHAQAIETGAIESCAPVAVVAIHYPFRPVSAMPWVK